MKQWSLIRSLTWIILSLFLFTLIPTYFLKKKMRESYLQQHDSSYHIKRLVQTGPQKGALKSQYLAELMELSIEHPQSMYSFDVKKAKQQLLRSHVIKSAEVKIIPPETLYVDYSVRQPIAFLYDYENIAFDEEGFLFPLHPFFPPKKLPEIYFNEKVSNPLEGKAFQLAITLVKLLDEPSYKGLFHVKRIDLSRVNEMSYGRREIILLTEDTIIRNMGGNEIVSIFPRILRLSIKNYTAELGNYLKLREQLLSSESKQLSHEGQRFPEKVIDLRLPHLAFIRDSMVE